jgi:hypothetical protein
MILALKIVTDQSNLSPHISAGIVLQLRMKRKRKFMS